MGYFCFFKQKTAYELRISDWSSDVCSSDLLKLYDVASVEVLEGPQGTLYGAGSLGGIIRIEPMPPALYAGGGGAWAAGQLTEHGDPGGDAGAVLNVPIAEGTAASREVGRPSCRERAGQYDEIGGVAQHLKKKTNTT